MAKEPKEKKINLYFDGIGCEMVPQLPQAMKALFKDCMQRRLNNKSYKRNYQFHLWLCEADGCYFNSA